MNNLELMKSRYKVIAKYPNSSYEIDSIVSYYDGTLTTKGWCKFFDQYPHLFRKLEWWEERKPEDLPEYVKYADAGGTIVYKVDEYDIFHNTIFIDGRKPLTLKAFLHHTVPATKEEYEAHQTQQLTH